MTEAEFQAAADAGQTSNITPLPLPVPEEKASPVNEYEGLLESLRRPRIYLSAIPTFVPKTFADQIQWIDDGISKRPVFYINGEWIDMAPSDMFTRFIDLVHWNSLDGFTQYDSGSGATAINDGNLT